MRFLVRATIPVDTGNEMIRDGTMEETFQKVMADVQPETVYFCVENGHRTLYSVVNVAETSDMVRVAEPFWLSLGCDVEFIPAMSQEDFAKAGATLAAIGGKY